MLGMDIAARNWGLLGTHMSAARHALGLTQDDAASLGETVSVASWRKLERGHPGNYSSRTLAGVERALTWMPGSALGILEQELDPVIDEVARARRRAMELSSRAGGSRPP